MLGSMFKIALHGNKIAYARNLPVVLESVL